MFIFTDVFYNEYLHAIDEVKEETLKIELKLEFLQEKENKNENKGYLIIQGSSVDNLKLTRIYDEILIPLLKESVSYETDINKTQSFIMNILQNNKKVNSGYNAYNFDVKVQVNNNLLLYITWLRTERFSLTIRNVKKA